MYVTVLASHGIYAFLSVYLAGVAKPQGESNSALAIPLCVIALSTAGAALAIDALAFRDEQLDRWIDAAKASVSDPKQAAQQVRQRVFSTGLIRWSLAGMTSITGLMCVLLGSLPLNQALMLVGVGALVHLYCRPKMAQAHGHIEQKLSSTGIA